MDRPEDVAAELAARRRATALRLHPDLGGDPAAFMAAMRELDEEAAAGVTTPTGPSVAHVTGGRARRWERRLSAGAARLTRDVRRRLPRSWPGSRRYGRL